MSQLSNDDRVPHGPRTTVRIETVAAEHDGRRIDNFLLQLLKPAPKSLVYKLLRSGQIRVNSGRVKPDYRLVAGDLVRVPPVEVVVPGAINIPAARIAQLEAAVLYEDSRFLILDKPAGMACHGGTGIRYGVIEIARALRPTIARLDLVHRLDRDTSGCLVLSKQVDALRDLHQDIRLRQVEKRYCALLLGTLPPGIERISAALANSRAQGRERRAAVDDDGKASETVCESITPCGAHSLVQLRLITGRMHQIRAHARHIGHPVAGDRVYGDREFNAAMAERGLNRLFLHASSISFASDLQLLTVTAPLPSALQRVLTELGAHG